MKILKFFFLFFLALTFIQCGEKNSLTMLYYETKCADKWSTGEGSTEEQVTTAVMTYFENQYGINFEDITISFDPDVAEACEACDCQSGRVIRVEVEDVFEGVLEEEGFFLE